MRALRRAVRWGADVELTPAVSPADVAGWMTPDQRLVTEYLIAENSVLRQQLCGRRIRYTALSGGGLGWLR